MSRFFTYDELRTSMPTVEAVTKRRDEILRYIHGNKLDFAAGVYGSTAWGLDPYCGTVHTRRSDVDIAVLDANASFYSGVFAGDYQRDETGKDVIDRIEAANLQIHKYFQERFNSFFGGDYSVGVGLTQLSAEFSYEGPKYISSTIPDHFRLLEKRLGKQFPQYRTMRIVSRNQTGNRITDIADFAEYARDVINEASSDLDGLDIAYNLRNFAKIENFPFKLARKILGRLSRITIPDSKKNLTATFSRISQKTPSAKSVMPALLAMAEISERYEKLIDESVSLTEREYYDRLRDCLVDVLHCADDCLPPVWMNDPKELRSYVSLKT